jgi:DNA-binding GntR family transcriptional regulator
MAPVLKPCRAGWPVQTRATPVSHPAVRSPNGRYIDGNPAIISDDYFDEKIVRGTELAEPQDTTREDILKEAGYEQVYDIDEIITRMPTPNEVTRLGIPAGTPVAEHIRTGYTADGKPVRVMISVVPGDTLILQYTIPT